MTQKEISAKHYYGRKAKGVCVKCGGEKPEGRFYCVSCNEKQNARQRKDRAFYRSIGVCPYCRINKLFGDEKQCIDCREKYHARRKPLTDEQRARANANQSIQKKKLHAERIEMGICTRCGKRKPEEGKKKCRIWLDRDAEMHRRRNPEGIIYREAHGLCIRCGEKMDRVGKVCIACGQKLISKNPYSRKNHVWKKMNDETFGIGVM